MIGKTNPYVVKVMIERTPTMLHFLRRGQLTALTGSSSPSKPTILRIFESVRIKFFIFVVVCVAVIVREQTELGGFEPSLWCFVGPLIDQR